MIPFDEARSRLLATAAGHVVKAQRVAVADAAGRVLAEDVRAPEDVPRFDHSTMDGYAVASGTFTAAGPWRRPVRGEARAGGSFVTLEPGTACRISTGAPLPAGADAVVPQEQTTRDGGDVILAGAPRTGAFVRRRSEDLVKGAVALARGTTLGPIHLGFLAMMDRAEVLVASRPRVVVVANGDELRAAGSAPRAGTSPECNGVAVAAMARTAGAEARVADIVGDDRQALAATLRRAFEDADLVVTVGGASVGDHDLVKPCLEEVGATLEFWRVAMKPGKPLLLGRREGSHVLGLPGNPASALVTFALFGLPLLHALQGARAPIPDTLRARLGTPVKREAGRREFLRGRLEQAGGDLLATPLAQQASGALTSMVEAHVLISVPAEASELPAGSPVDVLPLTSLGLATVTGSR